MIQNNLSITPLQKMDTSTIFNQHVSSNRNCSFMFTDNKTNSYVVTFTNGELSSVNNQTIVNQGQDQIDGLLTAAQMICNWLSKPEAVTQSPETIFSEFTVVSLDNKVQSIFVGNHTVVRNSFDNDMYLRSDRNNWNTTDSCKFEKQADGTYLASVSLKAGENYEFKIGDQEWSGGGYGSFKTVALDQTIILSEHHGIGVGNMKFKAKDEGEYHIKLEKGSCDAGNFTTLSISKKDNDSI